MTRFAAALTILSLAAAMPAGAQDPPRSKPKPPAQAHKNAAADNPFLSGDRGSMPVTTWFSLGPQHDDYAGAAYDKDEVTGGLRANESITVYARRHVLVPEDNQPGTLGEPQNSDAAQPVTPRLGEGCNKFTVCVDPSQKGLFSSIFGN
jgi:hypothetical protein